MLLRRLLSRLLLICAMALVAVPGPTPGHAAQDLVTDPEQYEMKHFREVCTGGASFAEGFAIRQDINNDGLQDAVIDEGKLTCNGKTGPDCNEDGCPFNFYLQVKEGGYFMISTARIYGYDFVQRFGNMVLVMKMHPRFCDRTDGDPCLVTARVRGTQFFTISRK